jgi:hypothetical protein
MESTHETVWVYLRKGACESRLQHEAVAVVIPPDCVIDTWAIWEAMDIEDDEELVMRHGLSIGEVCCWVSKNRVSYLLYEGEVF